MTLAYFCLLLHAQKKVTTIYYHLLLYHGKRKELSTTPTINRRFRRPMDVTHTPGSTVTNDLPKMT